jgi:hypothetical protein
MMNLVRRVLARIDKRNSELLKALAAAAGKAVGEVVQKMHADIESVQIKIEGYVLKALRECYDPVFEDRVHELRRELRFDIKQQFAELATRKAGRFERGPSDIRAPNNEKEAPGRWIDETPITIRFCWALTC